MGLSHHTLMLNEDEALFVSIELIRGIVLYLRIVGPVKWYSWPKLSEIICFVFMMYLYMIIKFSDFTFLGANIHFDHSLGSLCW